MKNILWLFLIFPSIAFSQIKPREKEDAVKITQLIQHYAQARETQDTVLLKRILTEDIDQLVSSGEWRIGIAESLKGMQSSTQSNPGSRRLKVEKIKFLSEEIALVDCRYTIESPNGTERNMWSSFTVLFQKNQWKITAIRNMNPTGGN
ncbi:MAG: nuclear transport factor 2 family protein [Algoriphagus sp.]|uniref:nuclear transport factor 2 family protein n=1 Tax=Algoriphagus sp. TaxID=1872435 RepID=UPI0027319222|nr:nuclear transport factor 2 family protein [Algoriphagus sp.]MDP2042866.1 nuclear transport factor 2 family protein [Algoriphagus sp.]MDP3473443.1 nuclear transport factor 2 family protein [Algoriphagus sp.]